MENKLKIGTVLIAKEDMKTPNGVEITKDKEYKILEIETHLNFQNYYLIKVDSGKDWKMAKSFIEDNFTIKRYTLTDLKEKKIAVKLRDYDEYKRLCLAVGDTDINDAYFNANNDDYYGVDQCNYFMIIVDYELEGRILLESIDEIDLEEKEKKEKKESTYICKYCGVAMPIDIDEEDCCLSPNNKQIEQREDTFIAKLESEIARLKEELGKSQEAGRCIAEKLADEMKEKVSYMKEVNKLKEQNNDVNDMNSILLNRVQELENRQSTTTAQSDRTRMAWEFYVHNEGYSPENAFKAVDSFLAKSKEVGNG